MASKSSKAEQTTISLGDGVVLTTAESARVMEALTALQSGDYSTAEGFASVASRWSGTERKARRMARVFGAVAIHAAHKAGDIGEGGKWTSQNAWAKAHGMSPSNASALNNLGRAISVGFSPDYPMWSTASDKAGNKAVAEALNKGRDGAEVDRLVQAAATKATAPRNVDKDATGQTAQTDEPTEPTEQPVSPFEAAKAHAKALDALAKDLSDEEFAVVARTVQRMLNRETTVRTKAARKSA